MKPKDDPELWNLLQEWQAPPLPPSLEQRVLHVRGSWRQFLFRGYIRVPVPVAFCLAVLMTMGAWRWMKPSPPLIPRVVVKTERVEVPVVRDRVVTKLVYRNRPAQAPEHSLTFHELRPVAELHPRIVRHENAKN